MRKLLPLFTFFMFLANFSSAIAASKGGGWSFGANIGTTSASQDDMDKLISRSNSRESGISTSALGSAYEFSAFLMYRFNGSMFALHFRPSYMWQSSDGENSAGADFNYHVNGFTFMPMLRIYLLESEYVKFFTQFGLGWGFLNGSVKENTASAKFSGSNMGFLGGLGAEFCFTEAHCMTIEGNFRSLPVQRMTYDSASGSFASDSLEQATAGKEAEINGRDFEATFSGIMGVLGYTMYF